MPKRHGNLAVVEDDMTDVDDDEFELDDDDDLEDEEEEASAPPPKPARKGSKRTPAPVAEDEDDDDDEDFEEALGNAMAQRLGAQNEPSRTPALRNLTDDQLVIELTELIMQGDDSEMTSILIPMFTGPRGPKIAKKLVREARDRAIAKMKRVADVACVNIETFTDDD